MNDETTLRAFFAPAREIQASQEDVDRVVSRVPARSRVAGHRHFFTRPVAWLASAALILAGLMAVPPVRAALGDAVNSLEGTFDGYFHDETSSDAPGRPAVASDSPPAWLNEDGRTGQRLLASEASFDLFVVREPSGDFGFALDESVGISDSAAGWKRQFADHDVVILGPIPDPRLEEIPLFGVNAASVKSVRVNYAQGEGTTFDATEGGFVAMLDVSAKPESLSAFDAEGNEVETVDLSYLSFID